MEQRRLRLGDILDDYCPRERRVTNHVVVAMIEEDIRQTRCTTCDAEHAYKGGKAPRRRKAQAAVAPPAVPGAVVARPANGDADVEQDSDDSANPMNGDDVDVETAQPAEPSVEAAPVDPGVVP